MAMFVKLPGAAIGADTGHLDQLSTTLKTAITQLEAAFKVVDNKINATTWAGQDATKTADLWNQTRASTMNNLTTMLTSLSTQIKAQSTSQTQTSSN
jgi:hypothetical protein